MFKGEHAVIPTLQNRYSLPNANIAKLQKDKNYLSFNTYLTSSFTIEMNKCLMKRAQKAPHLMTPSLGIIKIIYSLALGGNDTFKGGAGSDTISYENSEAVVVYPFNFSLNVGDSDGDNYESIENIIGSDFDDYLTGGSDNYRLEGGLGSDRLTGHSGLDLFVAFVSDGDKDIITDFETLDDKIELDIDDPSSVESLDDLYEVLSITITSHTNREGGNQNDTLLNR